MQTYWNLTDRERAALLPEQIEHYLAVERMRAGAVRPLEPTTAEPGPEPVIDKEEFWAVKLGYTTLALFELASEAAQVVDMGPLVEESRYSGVGVEHARRGALTVERVELPSERTAKVHAVEVKEWRAAKEAHEKAWKTFGEELEAYEKVGRELLDDLARVAELDALYRKIMRTWDEYLATAGGDERVAWQFLCKAYHEADALVAFSWTESSATPWAPTPTCES